MDVFLTHGYFIAEDPIEQKIMRPYPPLGLLYLSAYLKQFDFQVHVSDSTFFTYAKQQEELLKMQPKVVAIYANLMTKVNNIRLMNWIKKQPELAHTKVAMGGPDVSYNYENYLKEGADFVVIGEGEQTLNELTQALINKTDILAVNGIVFQENNQFIKTAARMKVKDMDSFPMPDRSAINLQLYLDAWKDFHGTNTLSISTQRGCPYTCKWCSTAVYGQSYRRRSPKLVADEIEMLRKTYHPDSLWFVDDVFTVNHRWLRELHAEFVARKIVIPFEIITRAERLNEEILGLLKEMGCSKIWIGAESGSQRIINEMDRRVDIHLVRDMILKTKEFGIQTGTFIMVGYPTETKEDIHTTVQYLKDANPDNFTITVAYPIKGTGLYEQIKNKMIDPPAWNASTDRDLDFKRTYSRKFYNYAVNYVVNDVNASKELSSGNTLRGIKLKSKSMVAQLLMQVFQ
ncbi:MAG: anaerobic magnesium-protoporphyrin IX monomethyl ester cyclase [Salibacteraceae bacterium]|jgi:anaerobic magnesium-protoporphyrin IX monomethyl ester cyclase